MTVDEILILLFKYMPMVQFTYQQTTGMHITERINIRRIKPFHTT